jgi:hypothetical protein
MKKVFLIFFLLTYCIRSSAHPMPSSIVELSILENTIHGEARIPLPELDNAIGGQNISNISDPFFKNYFLAHIKAYSDGRPWATTIENYYVTNDKDPDIGDYQEIIVRFVLTPPEIRYLRHFKLDYDVVMHQVISHSALVSVKQDWNNGLHEEGDVMQVGVIGLDVRSGKIYPLEINLADGSSWKGFKSMFMLGMQHIKEGTDHLLFLLVLLLPAMLLVKERRWNGFGGFHYSIIRLLKIVTAFTIGHSITLLIGALGWVRLPAQPVEILIAVSILVSAVHAIHPIFPGKESMVAAGFGLIHGLAFATVLSNLQLGAGKLALSVLGFNLGIEIMQIFVVALIVPWLIILSQRSIYKWVRITGAMIAAMAAIGWIFQRSLKHDNTLSVLAENIATNSKWIILTLAIVALFSLLSPPSTATK